MIPAQVQAFEPQAPQGRALAAALDVPFEMIGLHRFPDGEVMPRAVSAADTVIAYAPLDRPDEKLIALLLAADAWRRLGVSRLVLVAPYLCYMRQDRVFHAGEPLSRDVICGLIGQAFDRVVTVDAHMHRTHDLSAAFGGIEVDNLSAARPIAGALAGPERPVVIGPDSESKSIAGRVAERLGAELVLLSKERQSDDQVILTAPDLTKLRDQPVFLVDDICSSGATLISATKLALEAGARSVDIAVVHALFGAETEARLREAGARRVVSTTSVCHLTNAVQLAGLLAAHLRDEVPL